MAITPTLAQTIKSFIKYELDDLNVALPARVLEYNNEFQKATVQPVIKERYRDDKTTESDKDQFGTVQADMPVIIGVPVIYPSFNNGIVSAPLRKGDLVQLQFSQRSLDLWLHSEDEKFDPKTINPEDNRTHDFSDAVAIPGIYPFKRALGTHPEYFQIRYNVETDQECSLSFTQQGDLIIDVPGKIKYNCNGIEMYNLGGILEQHAGGIVSRVDGDVRHDWGGKYELYLDGTTVERRAGSVVHDYLDTYSVASELDMVRQSRTGKIHDNSADDMIRTSAGKITDNATGDVLRIGANIDDSSSGNVIVNAGGTADIKSGSTMTFEHAGVLDLDGSGVAAAPAADAALTVPEEAPTDGLSFSPAVLRFVVTHNSSFQYESKFFLIDNPTGGAETYRFRNFAKPNWITLSRPISTLENEDWSGDFGINGFGQDIIVVDLNEKTKDLPIGIYEEEFVVEAIVPVPVFKIPGTELFKFKVILEVKA